MHKPWTRITKSAGHRLALALLGALALVGSGALVVYAQPKAQPGFSITASPSSQTVTQGDQTTYTLSIGRTGGFSGPVSLSIDGLPTHATATWNPPSPVSGNSSTLTITTQADTATGSNYKLGITGTATINAKTVSQSDTVKLTVQPPAGFKIAGDLASSPVLGGPGVPLNLSLSNPNSQPLTVSNINAQIGSIVSSTGGCGTNNFAITQMPTSYAVTVPANSTRTLDQLGSQYKPMLRWIDLPVPQNACLGATLKFKYSASGRTAK
jgi:hypothetical protein